MVKSFVNPINGQVYWIYTIDRPTTIVRLLLVKQNKQGNNKMKYTYFKVNMFL